MALTPEQQLRMRQLRRQRGPEMRGLTMRFRQTQRAIDDALLADKVDADLVRRLAEEIGRIETERETARFEIEAGIRQILTPEQAALLRESRRAAP
jgi:Spy/CpxP family protein refolding chaperone